MKLRRIVPIVALGGVVGTGYLALNPDARESAMETYENITGKGPDLRLEDGSDCIAGQHTIKLTPAKQFEVSTPIGRYVLQETGTAMSIQDKGKELPDRTIGELVLAVAPDSLGGESTQLSSLYGPGSVLQATGNGNTLDILVRAPNAALLTWDCTPPTALPPSTAPPTTIG